MRKSQDIDSQHVRNTHFTNTQRHTESSFDNMVTFSIKQYCLTQNKVFFPRDTRATVGIEKLAVVFTYWCAYGDKHDSVLLNKRGHWDVMHT